MAFDPAKPYNDLPALPPMVDVESRAVLKACISARTAVAALKAAGPLIPNQGVLVNSNPLLEAQASSEIENIVTTTDQMFVFDGVSEGEADAATKAALRYRTALWEGYQALTGHYQFEAIHLFTDGNGRTGRVINLLYLVEQGLLDIPVLYLSRHSLRNKADYYSGLQSITETGAWEPWLLYMLGGVTETARWTMDKIVAVRSLLEETTERMRRDAGQVYSRELAELVFVRPYCRIAHVVEAGLAKRQTASTYLQALVAIGILREHKMGREKIFLNLAFIDLLKRD